MSNRGYKLEHDIEAFLLELAEQAIMMPLYDRCHRVPTSGAHRSMKGDVISMKVPFFTKQLMFECKRRKERVKRGFSFTLPEVWLTKNEEEAKEVDHYPIFIGAYTGAQTNRMFVVVDDVVADNFLYIPQKPIFSIKINNKKRFKIRKWEVDPLFNKDIYSCIELKGNVKNWILISFHHFDIILKKKRDDYGKLPRT